MYGEIKDNLSLRVKALELALHYPIAQPNTPTQTPEESVERAKVYERYLRGDMSLPERQMFDNPFSLIFPLMLSRMGGENSPNITPEMRDSLIKNGVDPNLVDAMCGKTEEPKLTENEKIDAMCDIVGENRAMIIGDVLLTEWKHPQLRTKKHRYETFRNGEIVSCGNDLWKVLSETFKE